MITALEFKSIFKLDSSCRVSKDTLKVFNNQITGAYLLYLEVSNIQKKKFKNIDATPLQAHFEPFSPGFQKFVNPLGSRSKFEVYYIDKPGKAIPFWTYTKYSNENKASMKNAAYELFKNKILNQFKIKDSKYGFVFEYRDYATTGDEKFRCHPNGTIWWDGIVFNSLFYRDTNNEFIELSSYNIGQAISNRHDIWDGEILKPIQKIINKVKAP